MSLVEYSQEMCVFRHDTRWKANFEEPLVQGSKLIMFRWIDVASACVCVKSVSQTVNYCLMMDFLHAVLL